MSHVQGSLVTSLLITFLPTLMMLALLSVWLIVLAGYRHLGKTRQRVNETKLLDTFDYDIVIQSCKMHRDKL